MQEGQKTAKVFFENLDGIRSVAFLLVFFHHAIPATSNFEVSESWLYQALVFLRHPGSWGVSLFFVLSGFLITYLLLTEEKLKERYSIKNFYLRRLLRIWPLYFFCVFFGFIIFPYIKSLFGEVPNENANPVMYILFAANFDQIMQGRLPDSSILGVLWSVAIEEQFYLFWPILLLLFKRNRIYVFFSIVLLSLVFRLYARPSYSISYLHTFSVMGDLALGSLLAWFAFARLVKLKRIMDYLPCWSIVLIYILGIILLYSVKGIGNTSWFVLSAGRIILTLFFGFIICEQCYASNSFYKMKNLKFLNWMGKYTYGLYSLHMIGILISLILFGKLRLSDNLWVVTVIEPLLSLILSIVIAFCSYHILEKPFLRLKDRFTVIQRA